MRRTLTGWLLLVPFAALAAQQPDTAIPAAATLPRDFDAAQREWNKLAAEARAGKLRPEAEFAPKFEAGAAAYADKEEAVPYLVWLVSRGTGERPKTAMATLMAEHVGTRAVATSDALRLRAIEDRAARLLGRLVTTVPGHVPARAVARGRTEGQAVRDRRRQQ